jgi:hypothetical protein
MEALMQRAAHPLEETKPQRPYLLQRWRSARAELANAEAALAQFARSCAAKIGAFDLASAHHAWERLQTLRGQLASAQMQLFAAARALFVPSAIQSLEGR